MSEMALPTLLGALALVAFLVALVVRGVWMRRTAARRIAVGVSAAWGQPVVRERDRSAIGALARLWPVVEGDGTYELSERTWRDLSMGAVFARIDRCVSAIGQQLPFRSLRTPHLTLRPLLDVERRASAFAEDEALRARFTSALQPLSKDGASSLADVIYGPPASLPRYASLFPIATVATLMAFALSFTQPWATLALIVLVISNIGIRLVVFRDLKARP